MANSSVSLSLQHNIHPSIYYSLHLKQLSSHEVATKKGLTLHTTSSAPPPFQLSVGSSMPFLITQGFSIMAHDALSPHWHDYEVHFCLFVLCFRWSTAQLVWHKRLKKQMCELSTKKGDTKFLLCIYRKSLQGKNISNILKQKGQISRILQSFSLNSL